MKKLILTAIVGVTYFIANAQEKVATDIVKFKDGTEYRGNIKEYKDDEYIKVIVGGNLITIENEQFDEIKSIGFNKLDFYSVKNGFWHEFQIGLSSGKSSSFNSSESHPLINVVSGYQFNQFLGVGLGSGYQSFSNVNIVPIFASIRGDMYDTRVTPFYYADLGYGIGVEKKDDSSFGNNENFKGGFLAGVGAGLRFKLNNTFLTTSVGYKLQKATTEREFEPFFFDTRFAPSGGETTVEKRNYKRVEFKIGIGF